MSKKKSILFISCMPYYQEKGSTLRTHATLKTLATNYKVDAVVYAQGSEVSLPDVSIYRTPKWFKPNLQVSKPSFSKILLDIFVLLTSFRLLLINRYTHIHTEDFEGAAVGYMLSKIFRKSYAYNLHNRIIENWERSGKKTPKMVKWIEKLVIKNSKFIILNWNTYKTDPIFKNKNTFLHYDSLTLEKKDLSINIPEKYLFYAGNFEKYQGIDFFLDAYKESKCDIPILIAGNPTNAICEKIKKMKLAKKVILLGRKNVEETNTLIQKSTYCILPRISGQQPSMKLIHYLSWNKPIIANDITCNHELLKDYNNIGILYSGKTDLINILNNLNKQDIDYDNLNQVAKHIKNNSNPDNFMSKYKSFI